MDDRYNIDALLCGELWDDFDHLVNVDELHPRFQILRVVVPDEFGLNGTTEKCANTLIMFLDENVVSCDAKVRFEYSELPALEGMAVSERRLLRDVEFEARPVKANRLSNGLDVGLF